MEEVFIPQLTKLPERTEVIQFEQFVTGLDTLTPVRGQLKVTHKGNYLEVTAQADTIITLNCHRCLQQYNHRLSLNTAEIIWLDEAADQPYEGPLEREVALEDLQESLSPQGFFQPDAWLYEQLCLEIPPRQLCDPQCPGIDLNHSTSETVSDARWASLNSWKTNFLNN